MDGFWSAFTDLFRPANPLRHRHANQRGHYPHDPSGVGKNRLEGNRLWIEVPNVEPAELFDQHKQHVNVFCQESGLAVCNAKLPDAAA